MSLKKPSDGAMNSKRLSASSKNGYFKGTLKNEVF